MRIVAVILMCAAITAPVSASSIFFSNGNPDGAMGVASRQPGISTVEIEAADDFILSTAMSVDSASFIGLLPSGTPLSSINQVTVELYRVFPNDSVNPPSGKVPTRTNSPSDNAFDDRDSAMGTLTFTASLLNSNFSVSNSVLNGINAIPNQTTGGEGPVSGEEVMFDVTFSSAFSLPADHYFFVPQVSLADGGNFYWLSSGTPPSGDLQAWVRNSNLDPDWLRVGTDIVGGTTPPKFNMSFSLSGTEIPEPTSLGLVTIGLVLLGSRLRSRLGIVRSAYRFHSGHRNS